jgi:hypothetical protein
MLHILKIKRFIAHNLVWKYSYVDDTIEKKAYDVNVIYNGWK